MPTRPRLLLIEDDATVRGTLRLFLDRGGFDVWEAEDCETGLRLFSSAAPRAVIADYSLPDGTALDLLRRFQGMDPGIPVIILTGMASVELAVDSMRQGARHFLAKPVRLEVLRTVLDRALAESERAAPRAAPSPPSGAEGRRSPPPDPFLGGGEAVRRLAVEAARFAEVDSPVLLIGETGTGKGVLARWLHAHGPRARGPLIELNCAGLPPELAEAELFGFEKGAFTGAATAKEGLLEAASGGTVFLDEIGDLDARVQPKLLKVLEDRRLRRLGDVREKETDFRLLAASNQDLRQRVDEGRFRGDLFFRLGTLSLRLPPLRERREDLPDLATALSRQIAFRLGLAAPELSAEVLRLLGDYHWPGNIRELGNVLERALVLAGGDPLTPSHVRLDWTSEAGQDPDGAGGVRSRLAEVEKEEIRTILREENGNVARAARRLGLARSTLYSKLGKHGLIPPGR